VKDLAGREVDYADAVVAEFRNKQAPHFEIDGHVVDAAPHVAQRDLRFQF